MKNLIIVLTLFFTVNLVAQNDTIETPTIAIKVAIGNTIQFKNHSIKFVEVIEDSRCPENVNCIWAGRARILVEIKDEANKIVKKELLFGQSKPGEIIDNSLFSFEDAIVKGLTLVPYPNSEEKTDVNSYRLLIKMEKVVD